MVEEKVQELREKDRLLFQQAKMASMGEIIDVIAHQWKQPLNSISMQKELIEMDINSGILDKESIQEAIEVTSTQIEHLIHTMSEFRMFFRPKECIEQLNLKSILNSIKILLKDELLKHTTALNITCSENILLEANANDIKHLLINLINNAKDEMVKSRIDSRKRIIDIMCSQNQDSIIISVEDHGLGIPENIIDKIFDANFSTKEDIGGTGIGLYMCKQIVSKYSGNITASNTQRGAVFDISLKR